MVDMLVHSVPLSLQWYRSRFIGFDLDGLYIDEIIIYWIGSAFAMVVAWIRMDELVVDIVTQLVWSD